MQGFAARVGKISGQRRSSIGTTASSPRPLTPRLVVDECTGFALTSRDQGIRAIVKMQSDAGDVSKATWRRRWRRTSEAGAERVWALLSAWMTS